MASQSVKYWHVYSRYTPSNPNDVRRVNFARSMWGKMYGHRLKDAGVPNGATIMFKDEDRTLPYVTHLINVGSKNAAPNDVIIVTNSDVSSPANIVDILDKILTKIDACFSYRRDFPKLDHALTQAEVEKGHLNAGVEFFAFRKWWWLRHQKDMPNMVMGAEAWDWALRHLIVFSEEPKIGRDEINSYRSLSYHESHNSVWFRDHNRKTLPSQKYNLALGYAFEKKYGIHELSLH